MTRARILDFSDEKGISTLPLAVEPDIDIYKLAEELQKCPSKSNTTHLKKTSKAAHSTPKSVPEQTTLEQSKSSETNNKSEIGGKRTDQISSSSSSNKERTGKETGNEKVTSTLETQEYKQKPSPKEQVERPVSSSRKSSTASSGASGSKPKSKSASQHDRKVNDRDKLHRVKSALLSDREKSQLQLKMAGQAAVDASIQQNSQICAIM